MSSPTANSGWGCKPSCAWLAIGLALGWGMGGSPVPVQAAPTETLFTREADARLFPYQVVEGSAAKGGLWEDHSGQPLTRAKPVLLVKGQKVQVLKKLTVTYTAAETKGPPASLEVAYVRAEADAFKNHDGRTVPFKSLDGWILLKRLDKQ